jgi:hypothetical protein
MALNNAQRDVLRELLSSQVETIRDAVKNNYELAIQYLKLAISEKTSTTFELSIDKLDQTVKNCLQTIHEIYTGKLSINTLEPFATQVQNSSNSSSSSNSSPHQSRTDISVQSGLLQDIKNEVTNYVGQHIQSLMNYKKFDEKTGNAFAHIADSNSRKLIIEAIHDLINEEINFAKRRIEDDASLRENRLEIELRKIENQVSNKLEPLRSDLTTLALNQDSQHKEYMKTFEALTKNICSMTNVIDTLQINVTKLKTDVATLKIDVAELNKALETLAREQSLQSGTLKKQQESIDKLLQGQTRQQQSIEALMQGQTRQQQSIEALMQGQTNILSFLQQGAAATKKAKSDGSSSSTSSPDSSPNFFSPKSNR